MLENFDDPTAIRRLTSLWKVDDYSDAYDGYSDYYSDECPAFARTISCGKQRATQPSAKMAIGHIVMSCCHV